MLLIAWMSLEMDSSPVSPPDVNTALWSQLSRTHLYLMPRFLINKNYKIISVSYFLTNKFIVICHTTVKTNTLGNMPMSISKMVIFCCYDHSCAFKSQLCKKEPWAHLQRLFSAANCRDGWSVWYLSGDQNGASRCPSPRPCPLRSPAQTEESRRGLTCGYGWQYERNINDFT